MQKERGIKTKALNSFNVQIKNMGAKRQQNDQRAISFGSKLGSRTRGGESLHTFPTHVTLPGSLLVFQDCLSHFLGWSIGWHDAAREHVGSWRLHCIAKEIARFQIVRLQI